jgi:hypothetical protein
MWVGGDAAFLVAMLIAVWVWLRAEEREGRRLDAKLDRDRARSEAGAKTSQAGARIEPAATAPHPPGD